jgi:hypothetical protein
MNGFDIKRALDLKDRLIAKESEIFPGIVGLPEELFEILVSNWGYFGAIDRIKELEGHIILIRAYKLIISMNEECLTGRKCTLHCEEDYLNCPDIEHFKKLAREELEKEGVI